jgi:hypothetical protein
MTRGKPTCRYQFWQSPSRVEICRGQFRGTFIGGQLTDHGLDGDDVSGSFTQSRMDIAGGPCSISDGASYGEINKGAWIQTRVAIQTCVGEHFPGRSWRFAACML